MKIIYPKPGVQNLQEKVIRQRTLKLTIFLTAYLLILTGLTSPAAACPDCPPCYFWNGSYCEWRCSTGQSCCGGSCCSNTCCNGTCCGAGQSCCNGTCCDNNKICCNGTCCPEDTTCCNGTCCSNNQCCDNGVCVPKCTEDGQCDYDSPGIQAGCQWQSETNHTCFPDQVDKTCMWILQYSYSTIAVCAACAPGCSRTQDDYCAFWKAETCRNEWIIGCVCNYNGLEELRPTYGSGNHYSCN